MHVAPPVGVQVQFTLVSWDGTVLATVAPVTDVPLRLSTVTVKVTGSPGSTVVADADTLTLRSVDMAETVSVSIAELLPVTGSVTPLGGDTLAVLERVPVALLLTVPLMV